MADFLHLLDKPEGWTSHDVVARMRRVLGERRVGHAGTLDPFATGLLLVAEGRATALLHALSLLPKRYLACARLGVATDTQDRTGVPLRTTRTLPSRQAIESEVERLRGLTMQRPPLYSAVKVRGERLYKAARRGETLEAGERPIRVYEIAADVESLPDLTLDLTVSRGTYVRTLAHDLGEALGCGAHLISLRRTQSGPFSVERALTPLPSRGIEASEYRANAVLPSHAVPHLPRAALEEEEARGVRHGRPPRLGPERVTLGPLSVPLPPGGAAWPTALFAPDGALLALAQISPEGVRLLRVFP
ncbi:MAG: tRNA pseudouridine(55) synthase TruB [Candidatus Eisenbacteria bacterium]|uniref:tRNA pseudouridine synthase B n=1 Tax=Eiseniibacteriota bacterium TaxID=2212470 RepID=A0A538S7X2_UNCEI|nr:MAG: tRNA pseudouridine(55) synthase TruB [Candidatus Eisenbacteria bacterium]